MRRRERLAEFLLAEYSIVMRLLRITPFPMSAWSRWHHYSFVNHSTDSKSCDSCSGTLVLPPVSRCSSTPCHHSQLLQYSVSLQPVASVPRVTTASCSGTPCHHSQLFRYPVSPQPVASVPRVPTASCSGTPCPHSQLLRYPVSPQSVAPVPHVTSQLLQYPVSPQSVAPVPRVTTASCSSTPCHHSQLLRYPSVSGSRAAAPHAPFGP